MKIRNAEHLAEVFADACDEIVVRTAVPAALYILNIDENGRIGYQGFPMADDEEGTTTDVNAGWVEAWSASAWPLEYLGSSDPTADRRIRDRQYSGDPTRRTKRRYAHELYPHHEEGEIRPLEVEVRYLYARAIGFDVHGSGWFDHASPRDTAERIWHMIEAHHKALLADAILQGMTGDEAWRWVEERATEESTEWIIERAEVYGIDHHAIKPYICGFEPDHHDHLDPPDPRGWQTVHRIEGRESDCPDCTEPAETALAAEEARRG